MIFCSSNKLSGVMECPKCGGGSCVKNGYIKGVQRHRCKDCGCQYTKSEATGRPLSEKLLAITLYTHGLSMRTI